VLSSIGLVKEQESRLSSKLLASVNPDDVAKGWPAVDEQELILLAQSGTVEAAVVLPLAVAANKNITLVHSVKVTCGKRHVSINFPKLGPMTLNFSKIRGIALGHAGEAFTDYFNERLRAEVNLQAVRDTGNAYRVAEHQRDFAAQYLPECVVDSEACTATFRTLTVLRKTVYQSLVVRLLSADGSGAASKHLDREVALVFMTPAGFDSFVTMLRQSFPMPTELRALIHLHAPLTISSQGLLGGEHLREVSSRLSPDELRHCLEFHVPLDRYVAIKKRLLHPQNPSVVRKWDVFSAWCLEDPQEESATSEKKSDDNRAFDRFRFDSVLEFFRRKEWISFHTLFVPNS
jgi:hypothetical protein